MPSRRQEKVARIVKEGVCDTITNHLSDPRIQGLVSVTRVEVSPDLRNAYVFLSIFAAEEKAQALTFLAIRHARRRIQSLLAPRIQSKFCPVLHFEMDEQFKKTLETMRLIDLAMSEIHARHPEDEPTEPPDPSSADEPPA
ncbi:MAG TPA: 30S ribosome-binding factor RbfA [Phycisphaerales bacterium]|nr:30S ribosome-binding factor RbfA [Phycisphaerales bacterium]